LCGVFSRGLLIKDWRAPKGQAIPVVGGQNNPGLLTTSRRFGKSSVVLSHVNPGFILGKYSGD